MWNYVFSDIDGTLLNKDRRLSKQTVSVLQEVKKAATIILISSRMPKAMIYFQEELGILEAPLVCYNGGLVLRSGKDYLHQSNIILDLPISSELTRKIYDMVTAFNVNLSLYSYDEWYTFENDYWTKREVNNTRVSPTFIDSKFMTSNNIPAHKIMVMGDKARIDAIVNSLADQFSSKLHLYRSKDTYLEISSAETSKGHAVNTILQTDQEKPVKPTSIAFGDNFNDISMFQAVDFGVAVNNAKPELLELADAVGLSNVEDGVAVFLKNKFN